jgi:hypothetical protein
MEAWLQMFWPGQIERSSGRILTQKLDVGSFEARWRTLKTLPGWIGSLGALPKRWLGLGAQLGNAH